MNWLVRSNFYIAFCAFVATSATLVVFNNGIFFWHQIAYSLAVLFGTKVIYTMLRLDKQLFEKTVFRKFLKQNLVFTLAALFFLYASKLVLHHYYLLFAALLICIGYGIHIFGKHFRQFSLRSFAWLKLCSIAVVWIIVTVLIPFLLTQSETGLSQQNWLFLTAQFLFIFALALPFDIVDHIRQEMLGFKTLPRVLGTELTKKLGRFLIFTSWIVFGFVSLNWFFAISICLLFYLRFLNSDLESKSLTEFTFQFDGLIILLNGLAIAFYFIM